MAIPIEDCVSEFDRIYSIIKQQKKPCSQCVNRQAHINKFLHRVIADIRTVIKLEKQLENHIAKYHKDKYEEKDS